MTLGAIHNYRTFILQFFFFFLLVNCRLFHSNIIPTLASHNRSIYLIYPLCSFSLVEISKMREEYSPFTAHSRTPYLMTSVQKCEPFIVEHTREIDSTKDDLKIIHGFHCWIRSQLVLRSISNQVVRPVPISDTNTTGLVSCASHCRGTTDLYRNLSSPFVIKMGLEKKRGAMDALFRNEFPHCYSKF